MPTADQPRKRIFKPRIQNRLLVAFVIVAAVPMTIALLAVVHLNQRVLEHDIYAKLETASLTTGRLIATSQDEALQTATTLVRSDEFETITQRKGPTPFEPPNPHGDFPLVALWLPDPAPGIPASDEEAALPETGARTLMLTQLNGRETLLSGAVMPVMHGDARIGQLAVGLPLGKSFSQDIAIQTGVVARIYHERAPQRVLRIPFDLDSTDLSAPGRQEAAHIAEIMRSHPQVSVILEGHTDDTGAARHNYHLSERRTAAIASELVALGVPRHRISRRNFGEARPITANTTTEGRAANRRVDVIFTFDENEVVNVEDLPLPDEAREILFTNREPYYDKRASLRGDPYWALYRPLVSRNGKVLGMLFLGIPQKYTFGATVGTWRFYPLWLGIGVLLALTLGHFVSRTISRPLRRFVGNVRQVAEGNIDQHVAVLSRDELGDLASAFNDMTLELRHLRARESEFRRRDRLAALGQMSAGIAHEIRNPLNIMRNAAQRLLRQAPAESDQREMAHFIVEEVDRLNRVVSQFLTFARQPRPEPQPTDVNALIRRTLGALEPEARDAGVAVDLQLDAGLPPALLDPEQGYRVLMNLAQNAFQQLAGRRGARLAVVTRRGPDSDGAPARAGTVQVLVSDNGPGIQPENLDRVFNPFFTTREEGVGLGLSLVHNIVTANNGEIAVSSVPGQGATFTITLPAAAVAAPPREGAAPAPAEPALQSTP